MTLGSRIRSARRAAGLTQEQLAEKIGVSRQAVQAWETKGQPPKFENLAPLAKALGVSLSQLTGEAAQPNVRVVDPSDELPSDVVAIPECRVTFGAGSSFEPTYEEIAESKPAYYREDWFRERHTSPEKCKRFSVHGDSMEPWIFDGDKILVDCSVKSIVSGRVYAFVFGEELRVKQLHTLLSGAIRVHSINPSVPDETINVEDLERFILVGRVIDRSGGSFL